LERGNTEERGSPDGEWTRELGSMRVVGLSQGLGLHSSEALGTGDITWFTLGFGTAMHLDVQSTSPALQASIQRRDEAWAAVAASVVVGAVTPVLVWAAFATRAKSPAKRIEVTRMLTVLWWVLQSISY
jgi:hypothetical protein